MNSSSLIRKHTLINAIQHKGKADAKAVAGRVISENPELRKDMKALIIEIKKVVDEVNPLTLENQKSTLERLGVKLEKKREEERELPPLPNIEKNVVMRLAPFPSGPLHIGNARMVILNDEYVKRYKGKLILVFDDTIGSEEKIPIPEAYDLITDGLKWLDVRVHETFYKSDRMKLFYEYAEKLIEMNEAYVCLCPAERLRGFRKKGVACECRIRDKERNIKLWEKMLEGESKEGEAVVRIKTDMRHPNPAFRDRVLLRISEREHPRVGKKYSVWPMLEYSWAIDDHFLDVTHILRGKDLIIEDMMEKHIWDKFGWEHPEFLHYGLLGIEGLKLSKSQARKAISVGNYSGWDDPRTWSLQSLKKRGIRPEAIRNFILSFGLSLNDITVPEDILYSENRKIIESEANRYFVVFEPVEVKIEGAPQVVKADAPLHPDYPDRGKREIPVDLEKVFVSKNDFEMFRKQNIRFMDLFNISIEKRSKYLGKELVQDMQKIQWVSKDGVGIKVVMPDGNIKLGVGEPAISLLKENDVIQMVRFGYCRKDKDTIFYFSHR